MQDKNVIVDVESIYRKSYKTETVYSGDHSLNVNNELNLHNPTMEAFTLHEIVKPFLNIKIKQPDMKHGMEFLGKVFSNP